MRTMVDLPDRNGLTNYLLKHAAPHLQGMLHAVSNAQIVAALVVPRDSYFRFEANVPIVASISDDAGASYGPAGFNVGTITDLIKACKAIGIITTWPRPEIYDEIIGHAITNQANVCIVETSQVNEAAWLKFAISANPTIQYGQYNCEIREALHG